MMALLSHILRMALFAARQSTRIPTRLTTAISHGAMNDFTMHVSEDAKDAGAATSAERPHRCGDASMSPMLATLLAMPSMPPPPFVGATLARGFEERWRGAADRPRHHNTNGVATCMLTSISRKWRRVFSRYGHLAIIAQI